MSQVTRRSAEVYHEQGFALALYASTSKVRVDNRGKGVKSPPLEEVLERLEKEPELNIGMIPEKEFMIVDFDVKSSKSDPDRVIEKDPSFLQLPECPSVTTPSTGRHFYFRVPYGLTLKTKIDAYKHHPVFGEQGDSLRRKVDLLGQNHPGVVLPPSSFGYGEYVWDQPIGAVETPYLPLRLLLIAKIDQRAVERGEEWIKVVERPNLVDGDFRNGVLNSFISKLYFALTEQENSPKLSREAAIQEVYKVNAGFNEPLSKPVVDGIVRRFEGYLDKNKQEQRHEESWNSKDAFSSTNPDGDYVDWTKVLIKGFSDGENYTLCLNIFGKDISFECSSEQLERPAWIARRCRHLLQRADLVCDFEGKKKNGQWVGEVLAEWFKIISEPEAFSIGDRLRDLLREYCQRSITLDDSDSPFKQAQHVVKDEEKGTFYVPMNGFMDYVRKRLDKGTAERAVINTLKSLEGRSIRKGTDRLTFYEVPQERLYD